MLVIFWSLVALLAVPVTLALFVLYRLSTAPRLTGKQRKRIRSAEETCTLYYFNDSMCSQKVRLAIAEKGLRVECVHVDIGQYAKFEQLEPWYLATNPNGTVPCLVHRGYAVLDSSAILEYLDEIKKEPNLAPPRHEMLKEWVDLDTRPQGVTACDTLQSATVAVSGELLKFSSDFFSIFATIWALLRHPQPTVCAVRLVHQLSGVHLNPPVMDKAFEVIQEKLKAHEDSLSKNGWKFLTGNQITFVDLGVLTCIHRLHALGIFQFYLDTLKLTHLDQWYSRMKQRPSFAFAFAPPPLENEKRHDTLQKRIATFRDMVIKKGPRRAYGLS